MHPRNRCPSEHHEQAVLVQRFRFTYPRLSKRLFSIPNGGFRNKREAARLKAEGALAGVPDLFLAQPTRQWPGLFIEMKRRTGGKVSKSQAEMIQDYRSAGYRVEVCKGSDQAWEAIVGYLSGFEAEQREAEELLS